MNKRGIISYAKLGQMSVIGLIAVVLSIGCMNEMASKVYASTGKQGSDLGEVIAMAEVKQFQVKTKTDVTSSIIQGMDAAYSDISPLNTFWGIEGNYHISYDDKQQVYITILNKEMKEINTISLKKEMDIVGNITQDQSGNYYIVYGQYDSATTESDSKEVMSFTKYDKDGKKLDELTLRGSDLSSKNGVTESGTKEPFNFANCELFIDDAGVLICFYGRVMYNGHQSSHAVYIDTASFERVTYAIPYVSHSFNQKAFQASNGDYIFAERGDAYGRGMNVTRISKGLKRGITFIPFHFRNGYIYQHTYATLAGITELSNGYALVGTSEKRLTFEPAKGYDFDESRNVFMQVYDKYFTESDSNSPRAQLLVGETRRLEGGNVNQSMYLEEDAVDYGVKWLTDYTGNYYASVPKMTRLNDNELLIMWEKKEYKDVVDYYNNYIDYEYYSWSEDGFDLYDESNTQFIESYYMVVDLNGNILVPHTSMGKVRISEFSGITKMDNSIYWSSSNGESNYVTVYQLDLDQKLIEHVKVERIEAKASEINLVINDKYRLSADIYPSNATNKGVVYHYDSDYLTIDQKGNIKINELGSSIVRIVSKDNPRANTTVKVSATDPAPRNLKAKQIYQYNQDYAINLTWDSLGKYTEYEVYRSNKKNSGYELLNIVEENEFVDTDISKHKVYYYKIKVYTDYINNPYSNVATGVALQNLSSVKLTKKSKTSATLSWSANKYADGYEVYYYNGKTKKYELVKTITKNTTNSYTKSKLATGKYHYFKVRSYKIVNNKKYYSTFSDKIRIRM